MNMDSPTPLAILHREHGMLYIVCPLCDPHLVLSETPVGEDGGIILCEEEAYWKGVKDGRAYLEHMEKVHGEKC